jgi:hypothetical protein
MHFFHQCEICSWIWDMNTRILVTELSFTQLMEFLFHIILIQKNPVFKCKFQHCICYYDIELWESVPAGRVTWMCSTEAWEPCDKHCCLVDMSLLSNAKTFMATGEGGVRSSTKTVILIRKSFINFWFAVTVILIWQMCACMTYLLPFCFHNISDWQGSKVSGFILLSAAIFCSSVPKL